jgi:Flp pilus assembly pilin Flp
MLALYLYIKNWLQSEKGQDLIEYALLVGLIALVCIVAIVAGGSAISTIWEAVQSALVSAAGVVPGG